jgi:hypothetical protein
MLQFQVVSSTSNSLNDYQLQTNYEDDERLQIGKTITLINPTTKKIKKFKIDFIKGNSERLIIRNSNNTLVLKRSI